MKSEVLSQFPWTNLTCLGLLIFFGFFVGVLAWVLRKDLKQTYVEAQNIPLDEDQHGR